MLENSSYISIKYQIRIQVFLIPGSGSTTLDTQGHAYIDTDQFGGTAKPTNKEHDISMFCTQAYFFYLKYLPEQLI